MVLSLRVIYILICTRIVSARSERTAAQRNRRGHLWHIAIGRANKRLPQGLDGEHLEYGNAMALEETPSVLLQIMKYYHS